MARPVAWSVDLRGRRDALRPALGAMGGVGLRLRNIAAMFGAMSPRMKSRVLGRAARVAVAVAWVMGSAGCWELRSGPLVAADAADTGTLLACGSGTHLCGSTCVSDTLVTSCGSSCTPCVASTGFSATCVAGMCGEGPPCPTGMAYIPAGSFLMGDADTASFNAQPPHMVTLSAYCMDLTEVTVAAYRGCTAPECTTPTTGSSTLAEKG